MTIQTQVSAQSELCSFRPRDYDVFAGLDVDHHSIAATFTNHNRLLQSLRLSYSAPQLLNYVRKHFPEETLPNCLGLVSVALNHQGPFHASLV